MKVSALIVLYNKSINDIVCLDTVQSSNHVVQIVVCDNSECVEENRRIAKVKGIDYLSMEGNKGLSKAYNAGITCCKGDVICLFDDDSFVHPQYFDELDNLWSKKLDWDIALPLVMSGNSVLSPCYFNGFRSRTFDPKAVDAANDNINGINSGMAIKKYVYNIIQYNEKLFLDLVDHQFCIDAHNADFKIVFCESMKLGQNYSFDTNSLVQAKARMKVFEKDAKVFYSSSLVKKAYCTFMLMFRKIKLYMKYRNSPLG
ncbi:MAG: glycosyltransferase [Eggerthellaceae bacterium]|jgi:GT2 family glycosyltransferase|nr:glycosyltransferase [Eggerthellaceae bacterium]MCH4220669.1 glycosyltransferase [Eggerthellaceae bacterium]